MVNLKFYGQSEINEDSIEVDKQVMSIMAGAAVFHDPLSLAQAAGLAISMTAIYGCSTYK